MQGHVHSEGCQEGRLCLVSRCSCRGVRGRGSVLDVLARACVWGPGRDALLLCLVSLGWRRDTGCKVVR